MCSACFPGKHSKKCPPSSRKLLQLFRLCHQPEVKFEHRLIFRDARLDPFRLGITLPPLPCLSSPLPLRMAWIAPDQHSLRDSHGTKLLAQPMADEPDWMA
jgi:hypothetical protein